MRKKAQTLDFMRTGADVQRFDQNLRKRVIGQDEAIREIVSVYQAHSAGMNGFERPVGSFLFLGPTGTGKTRLAEAVAESLAQTSRAVLKIDCAEFQHSHEIAKLIGSPPGYLGHRETPPLLSQENLNQYHTKKVKLSFVLFDEIEKASDALWNLLLGILDKATLTLGDNRRVDFSHTFIFMTSNLGAAEMTSLTNPSIGFQQVLGGGDPRNESLSGKIQRAGIAAVRRKFTPEFINRIDSIVVFKPLGEAELRQILELELTMVQRRICGNARGNIFMLRLTDAAKNYLLLEGKDSRYAARQLKRTIERYLVCPLSQLISTEQIHTGDVIRVEYDIESGRMVFIRESERMSVCAIKRAAGYKKEIVMFAKVDTKSSHGAAQIARVPPRFLWGF